MCVDTIEINFLNPLKSKASLPHSDFDALK